MSNPDLFSVIEEVLSKREKTSGEGTRLDQVADILKAAKTSDLRLSSSQIASIATRYFGGSMDTGGVARRIRILANQNKVRFAGREMRPSISGDMTPVPTYEWITEEDES
mgnify:CR=1 FL=1